MRRREVMLENNGTLKQHLTISKLTLILLTIIGVFGGIFLSNPLNVQAQNVRLHSPRGVYTPTPTYSNSTKTYSHLLTATPAPFPSTEDLWTKSEYAMNYQTSDGMGNPSNFLRHQIFVAPLKNGLPPETVKYYNSKDENLGSTWSKEEASTVSDLQTRQSTWDRYTGIVTKPSTGEKEFQIVGTAVPYRWFHTTYRNHAVRVLVEVFNKDTKQRLYKGYDADLLPIGQTRRYMLNFWYNDATMNNNRMANSIKSLSDIQEEKYFSSHYGMSSSKNWSTMNNQVTKLCGLGIVGARQNGGVSTTDSCNYIYDYAGFQVNIPIQEIMVMNNPTGRNEIEVTFKLALSVVAPGQDGRVETNYIVAHLDILTDIQVEVPLMDENNNELGTLAIVKQGTARFDAQEKQLYRNPLLARTTFYREAYGQMDKSTDGWNEQTSNYHPRNSWYLGNRWGERYPYNQKEVDANGVEVVNSRNFHNYVNQHAVTVIGANNYHGVQYGWLQNRSGNWNNHVRDSDPYKNYTRYGYAYAPSEYFYVNNISVKLVYTPNPVRSENVEVRYIDTYTKQLIPEFDPNPELVNITEHEGEKVIEINPARATFNRGGREWRFVATEANPAQVTRSYTNTDVVYFEYERTPDPVKEINIYYANVESKGEEPTAANLINSITPNPEKLIIDFKDTITHTNTKLEVNDRTVPRRRWKFEEGVGNPVSNTLKYDVGDDGVYNTADPSNKNLTSLFYYYTRYDDVQVMYVDGDTLDQPGGPDVILAENSPVFKELAFGDTLTVEGEDEFLDNNGNLWQLDDSLTEYPRVQTRTNDKAESPEPMVFVYRRPYNVKVEHRQLLSDGTPEGLVSGEVLHREDYNLRLDRYAILDAMDDGTIPGRPNHNYIGAISVDGGTTILPHEPRQVEMLIEKGMNQIIFYYMEPISCETAEGTFNGPNLVSCTIGITELVPQPDRVLPYINGYLAKLGDEPVNNIGASSYVYNYAPLIQPEGVFAVRAVNVRAVGGGDVVSSTNDQTVTYLTDELDDIKPKRYMAPNIHTTTDVKLTNAPNAKHVSELSKIEDLKDMSDWGDGTGVSLVLDNDNINRGTLGDVEFTTSYKYIDTIRHNYQPTLVYNGVSYMAEYVDTTLDYEQQKAVEFTTEVEDAGHDYGESFGNAGTSEFMFTVGFERVPFFDTDAAGNEVLSTEISKFYEIYSNAYDSHTRTFDTQRAVEVDNKIYYVNMLAYADLPYMNNATKSTPDGDRANVLTFDKDNMWYLVGNYDEQNPTLDEELVDVQSIYNATDGTTLAEFLDSKVSKRFNTSVIPDPMSGEFLLNYDKVIPLVYGKYTDEELGQSLELITKDVFAVGSDSGYQVVVKDAREEPSSAEWKNGWKDVDVYTGEQYGVNNSVRVLTNRNLLVNALTDDLGLTHAVSDSDKLVTKGRGSLFFLPVDIKLNDVEGNEKYHNRTVVTDLGLNDATYFQDDIITVDTYLFGRGNDVIYSPQRMEIEDGKQVETVDVLINNAALNDYKNIPSEQWKTSNGTRMLYSPVLKPFIKSTPE